VGVSRPIGSSRVRADLQISFIAWRNGMPDRITCAIGITRFCHASPISNHAPLNFQVGRRWGDKYLAN
jgi:hypothetical protein